MDTIMGLIGLAIIGVVIWLIVALYDTLGGPGVIASAIGGVVLIIVVKRFFNRIARINELRETPDQVTVLSATAKNSFEEAAEALNQAKVEFEEKRAPIFWDRLSECNSAIVQCSENLEQARALTDDYNHHAPKYKVTDPLRIEPVSPVAYDDTMTLLDEMSACSHKALAVAEFGVVYETRRQAERVLDRQEEVAAMTREAVYAAREAAHRAAEAESAADRARRASKRAAGDWF